jgi:cell division protein FtsL
MTQLVSAISGIWGHVPSAKPSKARRKVSEASGARSSGAGRSAEKDLSTPRVSATYLKRQDVKIRRDLRDMGFLYVAIFAVVLTVGVLFSYLWCRVEVVNMGYEMTMLNNARSTELDRNKRLRLEITRLKSTERIEGVARELGLAYPASSQVVRIK